MALADWVLLARVVEVLVREGGDEGAEGRGVSADYGTFASEYEDDSGESVGGVDGVDAEERGVLWGFGEFLFLPLPHPSYCRGSSG